MESEHTQILAANTSKPKLVVDLFAKDVLRTTGASNVGPNVPTSLMKTRSGARLVWRSAASVLDAMDTLLLMLPHCAVHTVKIPKLSVPVVGHPGSAQCVNPRLVPQSGGLLEKMFAENVQILQSVDVMVILCANMVLASARRQST